MIEYFPRVLNDFLNEIGRFKPKFGVIPLIEAGSSSFDEFCYVSLLGLFH